MERKAYILLKDLEVYQLARNLSRIGWKVYEMLDWQDKRLLENNLLGPLILSVRISLKGMAGFIIWIR